MKLLTKEIRNRLPKLYSQENEEGNAIAYVKFFCPWNQWTWYATEGEPVLDDAGQEIDFQFFGWVEGLENEMGYFNLSELEYVTGPWGLKVERDLYWSARPLKEIDSYKDKWF